MRALLPPLLFALTVPPFLAADNRYSAADIVDAVSISFYSDHDDEALARQLRHLGMSEQLSPHIVQYFRFIGVGPKALQQLTLLQDKTASLPPPSDLPFSIQPIPADAEQRTLQDRLLRYAQSYIQTLPDLICTQNTRRFTNGDNGEFESRVRFRETLTQADHFSVTLRFVGGREQASLKRTAASPLGDAAANAGRIMTTGEFGGDLIILFGSTVHPQLSWDHWEQLRGARTAVLRYSVGSQSRYTLEYCCFSTGPFGPKMAKILRAPVAGLVYINPETGAIARLTIQAVHLPPAFPIKESNSIIDYGPISLGGRTYMLPSHAVVFSRMETGQKNRNEITFSQYRKFEAESTLSFPKQETSPAKR